jgi:hypothetical protein
MGPLESSLDWTPSSHVGYPRVDEPLHESSTDFYLLDHRAWRLYVVRRSVESGVFPKVIGLTRKRSTVPSGG